MFHTLVNVYRRSIAAFLAFLTICTVVFTELGGAVVVHASSSNLLDGTKVSAPVKGTSYYFDFLGNRELSSAQAGEYGLLTVSEGVKANSHGQQHSTGTSLTIKLAQSSTISIGYCSYDTAGTGFTVSSDTGTIGTLPVFPEKGTYKCYETSGKTYSFEYAADGEEENSITIHFNSTYYIPYIKVEPLKTESQQETPEENTIYTYDFSNQAASIIVPLSYDAKNPIKTLTSDDGFLKINGNGTMYHHGSSHGLVVKQGNSFEVKVAGNAYITFELCGYSNQGTIDVSFDRKKGQISKESILLKGTKDGQTAEFAYKGNATTLTFTINGNGYLHGITVANTTDDVDVTKWEEKSFSFAVAGVTVSIEGAKTQAEKATARVSSGKVYYAGSESAYLQLPLDGNALNSNKINNKSEDVVASYSVNADGDIVATMKDQTTLPHTYTIKIQDSKKFETPEATGKYEYDFLTGAVKKAFTSTNPITSSFTTDDGIVTISKGSASQSPYWHGASHGLLLNNKNYIEVEVAGDAQITFSLCEYGSLANLMVSGLAEGGQGKFSSDSFLGSSCKDTTVFTYTGEATKLRFTVSSKGTNYLHKISVRNLGQTTESEVVNKPLSMPASYGKADHFTIYAYGQKLKASHKAQSASATTLTDLGYYLFAPTKEMATMEADILVKSVSSSSTNGIFFGLFDSMAPASKMAAVGLRGDGKIRTVYNKAGSATTSAGGLDLTYSEGDVLHVAASKDSKGINLAVTINGKTITSTLKYSATGLASSADSSLRYGIAFSNAEAVIMNLTYTAKNGTVLYDQNACYEPVGSLPQVGEIYTPVVSKDRTKITVQWAGDSCKDDASYHVELSTDGGATFKTLSKHVTEKEMTTDITEDGAYQFRITGIVGAEASKSMVSEIVTVVKPLETPVVTAESRDSAICLTWKKIDGAVAYEVYRRSSEEQEFVRAATVCDGSFKDVTVVNETPYYYYVIAKGESNESNPSETVMTVPSAGHAGAYVYEAEAADIAIKSKSDDTVFTDTAVIEGTVDREGTMKVMVNGQAQQKITLAAYASFVAEAKLVQGRNDVELLFTDARGKTTRQAYNFVFLTNYDMVVDSSFTGKDGAALQGLPSVKVYKSIQAAVDAVPYNNASRVVIYIKEGSYREHLVVAKPNVTLIGQDRELVNINYYDPVESPAGGDTAKRCAVFVTNKATNFNAENLTMENTYEYIGDGSISNESADALRVDANNSVFVNVKLLGYQDTLDAGSNYQYYYKCYIAGNVDYIYGSAQALFEDCDLVYRYSKAKNAGYITAPKTSDTAGYGYIFNECRIYAEEGCSGSKYLLARPWGPDGAAAFINCYMGSIVNTTAPYSDMSGNLASEARFCEYYTYGPGFAINKNRPQISSSQAAELLTVKSLGWNPQETLQTISSNYVGSMVPEQPEATEAPEGTQAPEATEAPEGTQAPEATEAPEETQAPEATEAPASTPVPTLKPTLKPTLRPTASPAATQKPQITVGQVKDVKATSISVKSAVISWSRVSQADGYRITYRNAAGKTVTKSVAATRTSVLVDGLAPASSYDVRVKAYRVVNKNTYYGKETTLRIRTISVPAVSGVKAKSATEKAITVSWQPVAAAEGYVLTYKNALGKTVKTTLSAKKSTYKADKLLAGKTYTFTIQAFVKVNGKTIYGSQAVKKLKTASVKKPSKPIIAKLSSTSKNKMTIQVKAVKGADGYEAAYSLKKNKGFKKVDLKSSTKKDIKKLSSKKTYYVKVRSYKTVYAVQKGKLVTKKVYSGYSTVKRVKIK